MVPTPFAEQLAEPIGHAKVHRSPAHQWLRGVLFDLFGEDKAGKAT